MSAGRHSGWRRDLRILEGRSASGETQQPKPRRFLGFAVRCEDGNSRHARYFASAAEAHRFAEWGHICTRQHSIEERWTWTSDQPAVVTIEESIARHPSNGGGVGDQTEAEQRIAESLGCIWHDGPCTDRDGVEIPADSTKSCFRSSRAELGVLAQAKDVVDASGLLS